MCDDDDWLLKLLELIGSLPCIVPIEATTGNAVLACRRDGVRHHPTNTELIHGQRCAGITQQANVGVRVCAGLNDKFIANSTLSLCAGRKLHANSQPIRFEDDEWGLIRAYDHGPAPIHVTSGTFMINHSFRSTRCI